MLNLEVKTVIRRGDIHSSGLVHYVFFIHDIQRHVLNMWVVLEDGTPLLHINRHSFAYLLQLIVRGLPHLIHIVEY